MRRSNFVAPILLLMGSIGASNAAEVSRDVTINASPAEVWKVVGPFCAISDWYPGITTCKEEQIGGTTHRRLMTQDSQQFFEKLLKHDDAGMTYSYTIEQSPLPVADYRSTFSVTDVGGKAHITWRSTFSPKGVSE